MSVGLLVCSYNDMDLAEPMYNSLIDSMPDQYPYGLCVVDAGSTDGSVEFWQGKTELICAKNKEQLAELGGKPDDLRHLSRSLNLGARWLLRGGAEYILHIHPDMLFPQHGWVEKMVECHKQNPDIGKLAADWVSIHQEGNDRPGNQCPWLMPRAAVEQMWNQDGYLFDPNYVGIGGSEDWDLNARLIHAGWRVWITSEVVVEHEGMGTRSRNDTNQDALQNRRYYKTKWGTELPPV